MRSRVALLVLALAAWVAVPAVGAAGTLTAAYLAVGQNSAGLYRAPCGDIALVDAGQGAADEVLAQLDAWGDRGSLRWVNVSHYDADHVGDVVDVLAASGVSVDAVYDRGGDRNVKDSQAYRAYYDYVTGQGLRAPVDIGATISLCSGSEQVTFRVVSAGTDGTAADEIPVSEENDRGICLLVTFDAFDVATCGDVNGTDEGSRSDVESAVAEDFGDVDWVVVNHHGAKYSSNTSYVTTLKAQAGIVSVGKNSYGHPDPNVLNRWATAGTTLFQTQHATDGSLLNGGVTLTYGAGASSFTVDPEVGSTRTFAVDGAPAGGEVIRLAGDSRVLTAVEVSKHVFSSASTAVIATADNYPDALAGAVLAAKVSGPLLLTPSDELAAVVQDELARLDVDTVLLLGGKNSISASIETQLATSYDTRRIFGNDRYETAVAIAEEITSDPSRVVVVSGTGYPDAVSASAYAAANQWPIIPVTRDAVPAVVKTYLQTHDESAEIVGGTSTISDQTVAELPSNVVGRLWGPDRFRTSYAVAKAHLVHGQDTLWLATGLNFPDALAAGGVVAATGGVLMLSPTDTLDLADGDDPRFFVETNRACDGSGSLVSGVLVGGKNSLTSNVGYELKTLLDCQPFPEPTPSPSPSPSPTQDCHPAYPDFCIPPPPPDLNCSDISQKNFTVDHTYGDPHGFDGNGDGIGCET